MVGEVKGIEMMGVLIAGRGARERGDRRLEVRTHSNIGGPVKPATVAKDDDDDDVYYSKGRRPREDEEGEESYEKQRQRP